MSAIVDFYRDEAGGERTHLVAPPGYAFRDIVWNWSDDDWEEIHDFIQWIFPLDEPSHFNPEAPLLTAVDIATFRADVELQRKLFQAFERFLGFLGLACQQQDGRWITQEMSPHGGEANGLAGTPAEVARRQRVWKYPNHNWLRITRCLRSLRLLGLEQAADSFFQALREIYAAGRGVTPETFAFWEDAARDKGRHSS